MKGSELKKIKKRSRGRLTIHEINSIQTAYFKKLTFFDYLKLVGMQAIIFGAVIHFLFYYVPATIIATVLGACFGLFKHLPNIIKKNYYHRSYVERNRFLNNFTQLIANENMPLLDIIEKIIPRLEGELYDDMTILLARITTADSKLASKAFKDIVDKYEDDIIFGQYFEQIQTVFIEGHRNVESFKELKKQHNIFLEKLKDFQKDKAENSSNFVGIVALVALVIGVLIFGNGLDVYLASYAHQAIGVIMNTIYVLLLFIFYVKLMNYIYDDSITTL